MDEVIGLFPTPFLRVPGLLDKTLVGGLVEHFVALAVRENNTSPRLSHTEMLRPGDSPLFVRAAAIASRNVKNVAWDTVFDTRFPAAPGP